jgi:uncharacterized membrane protein YbhN (UPF0104 family)
MQVATNAQAIDAPADGGRPGLPTGRRRLPRLTLSGGKLLLSGGLIGYLLYRYGPDHARLERLDPILCTITVAIFALQIALNTVRWRLILTHITGTEPPFRRLFGIYYASTFLSQILPSIGGDLVRVLYRRTIGSTFGLMVISVFLDRGLAFASLLIVALPSLLFLSPIDPGHTVLRSVGLVAGCGLAAAYGGCLMVRAVRRSRIWTGLPQWIQTLVASGDWSLTSRTGLCCLIPLSAFVHLLSIAAIFLAAHAVHVPLTLSVVLAIGPILLLAQVLPISVGGWGVREAAAVALLAMTGVDATSALLVSLMFGVLLVLSTLPGALFWLTLRE